LIDREQGYLYTKMMIWYNDSKIEESQREELDRLIEQNLPTEDRENIMRTIADAYRDEGMAKGIETGMAKGIETGMAKGFQEGVKKTALKMLQQKLDLKLISSVTGLSSDDLLKLKNRKLAS
jgi:predicted transposase/invertase (TIGR01784 family)